MSDDETKQLLRDILATQREQLEIFRYSYEVYDKRNRSHDEATALYKQVSRQRPWDMFIRAITGFSLVALLAYVVISLIRGH